jgi:hypothetical protein
VADKTKSKFKEALRRFLKEYKKYPNVMGILFSGSYIHSKPDKNADLVVYVILEKSKMRTRTIPYND